MAQNYSKKALENRRAYNRQYNKAHVSNIKLSLNNNHDIDIITFLNSKESKSGYIKDLIRKDMNNGN